jgi:hypothetical protein
MQIFAIGITTRPTLPAKENALLEVLGRGEVVAGVDRIAVGSEIGVNALPSVVGTAPAIARGTAGVESAGGAEEATTARLKAFEPGAYGEVGGNRGMAFFQL